MRLSLEHFNGEKQYFMLSDPRLTGGKGLLGLHNRLRYPDLWNFHLQASSFQR